VAPQSSFDLRLDIVVISGNQRHPSRDVAPAVGKEDRDVLHPALGRWPMPERAQVVWVLPGFALCTASGLVRSEIDLAGVPPFSSRVSSCY